MFKTRKVHKCGIFKIRNICNLENLKKHKKTPSYFHHCDDQNQTRSFTIFKVTNNANKMIRFFSSSFSPDFDASTFIFPTNNDVERFTLFHVEN